MGVAGESGEGIGSPLEECIADEVLPEGNLLCNLAVFYHNCGLLFFKCRLIKHTFSKHWSPLHPTMLHKHYMRAYVCLSVLIFRFMLAAAVCMRLNKQISMVASYQFETIFKFFVIGNAIACGYTLFSMLFITNLVEGYLFHLFDLVLKGLVMASVASTTTISYVGKKGNENIGWNMVCPYYENFHNRTAISIFLSYLGFVLLLLAYALSYVYKTRLSNNL